MPRIPGTNNRQSSFLRAFKVNPTGPAPADWPSPALLRKWLRRPSFCRAIQSLLSSLRFQADFQLSAAATAAISSLSSAAAPQGDSPDLAPLYRLLRLAHLRQRFTPADVDPSLPASVPSCLSASAASSAPSSDTPDAPFTPPPLRRIGQPRPAPRPDYVPDLTPAQLDLIAAKHELRDLKRMTRDEFGEIARINGFAPPLEKAPCFPDPTIPPAPPAERFYYELLKSPHALLWYLKLYTEQTGDPRYKAILQDLSMHIPHRWPTKTYPDFAAPPSPFPP